jgi:hypothetical protein
MKILNPLVLIIILLTGCDSAVILTSTNTKHDNGNHKGWYKNPNNPHNPAHGNTSKATPVKTNKGTTVKPKGK